jgi:hypothetical protein
MMDRPVTLTFDEWMAKYYPDDGLFVSEDDDRTIDDYRNEYEHEKKRDLRAYEKWVSRRPEASTSEETRQ